MSVYRLTIILISFVIASVFVPATVTEAFSDQVIQKGATGDDVVELQARLQYNGFYNGPIDGVFGWGTYWSVKNFQEEFGLEEVDGLVGEEMKRKLEASTEYDEAFVKNALENGREFTHYGDTPKEIQKGPKGSADKQKGNRQQGTADQQKEAEPGGQQAQPGQQGQDQQEQNEQGQDQQGQGQQGQGTEQPDTNQGEEGQVDDNQSNDANIQKAMNVPDGYSENDIQIMANAVYGEARGEPFVGQVAVAAVILNRISSPEFPNTASGVIFEPRAFTAVADGQIYLTPNEQARKAVLDAINGQDPSNGALYYYNPAKTTSNWIYSRPTIKTIGKHVFAK
ncbi:spore cortex-lytic enzyme [Alteribacillus iranensis]|uniref:Spore cortex-lytic enzyme n=1 Tax=Alteribacillus iranensis TaxID=930128 RepID=A0A1I1ZPA1_9BACI|nr:spore cortex-lytic enzyme [Alteribacillus iranensis]SFE33519.1 N-acetylmuramoyl-L-alanine amidase [Alteribacillus iranensis]